jgi:hypothetical protein
VTRVASAAVAAAPLSASLFCGNTIHMAQPAMTIATASSKASLALELPDDHPAIRITAPSTDGARRLPPRARKKPYGLNRTASLTTAAVGFAACHQSPKAELVSCHLDNIAAAA